MNERDELFYVGCVLIVLAVVAVMMNFGAVW
jgi:hypothetical protein